MIKEKDRRNRRTEDRVCKQEDREWHTGRAKGAEENLIIFVVL